MPSLKDNLFPMHCGTAPLAHADDGSCTPWSSAALKAALFYYPDSSPCIAHQCTVHIHTKLYKAALFLCSGLDDVDVIRIF